MFRRIAFLGVFSAMVASGALSVAAQVTTDNLNFESVNLTMQNNYYTEEDRAAGHIQTQIRSGAVKSKGVNLGGWLVAEHWMTTEAEFWKGLSEDAKSGGEYYAISKAANRDTARALLDKHHATYITEQDIKEIAAAGLNTVRVPVGFWIIGFDNNDPSNSREWEMYTKGTIKYLDLLIRNWAKTHNVAVLISVHAAKGSQNGQDHSSPTSKGNAYWSDYRENLDNTHAVATFLAERYRNDEAFLGLGLLNEPSSTTKKDVLYQYYQDVYWFVRNSGNDCVLSIMPLLYEQGPDQLVGFMQAPTFRNVWVEWHPYFVWGYEQTSERDLIDVSVKQKYQGWLTKWHSRSNANRLFMGEWSYATAGKFGNNQAQFYEFAEAQAKVHNQAKGGWTFWSWKVSGDSGFNGWSLRSVLRDPKLKSFLFAK